MQRIVARHRELNSLDQIYHSGKSEFLAIYGRRRVGKTFLIREFFCDKGTYFHITGIKDSPASKQVRNFSREFKRVFGRPFPSIPKDLPGAFFLLREVIDTLAGFQRII